MAEAAGYRRFNRLNDLLRLPPDLADNNGNNSTQTNNTEPADITNFTYIYKSKLFVSDVYAFDLYVFSWFYLFLTLILYTFLAAEVYD